MPTYAAGPGQGPRRVADAVAARIQSADRPLLEMTDRSADGRAMLRDIRTLVADLLSVPATHTVLLLPGGGTQQFSMIGYSLQGVVPCVRFVETDYWTARARSEIENHLSTASLFDGQVTGYRLIPLRLDLTSSCGGGLFFTTNNTASGTRWVVLPTLPEGAICIADMSSDLFGRLPDFSRMDIIVACAQKNFGVCGMSIAIIRSSLLERMDRVGYLSYRSWHCAEGLYSTFPMVAAAVALESLKSIHQEGLTSMQRRVYECSNLVYRFLDSSRAFTPRVMGEHRSKHNVTFEPSERSSFSSQDVVTLAEQQGLWGLKGHPSVGGLRASFYFGAEERSASMLVSFLSQFEARTRAD